MTAGRQPDLALSTPGLLGGNGVGSGTVPAQDTLLGPEGTAAVW